MRARNRRTTYRGHLVTIRWVELDRGDSWGPGSHRFTASYLIEGKGAEFGKWHHFPDKVFIRFDAAAAYALAQAQEAIDASMKGPA
jgi:hypothetical protein